MLKAFGFCRICAASPPVAPTAVADNVSALVDSALDAAESGADICVFPELCVTGYTCGDLFYHASLLDAAEAGLASFLAATRARVTLFVVGLPLRLDGLLINGAAACCQGRIIGVVPKSCLPNTQEFYERRWFASGIGLAAQQIRVCGAYLPLGTGLLFESASDPACRVGIEVCEDLWSPQPPSQALAVGGATIICNLSASNERVGKADYRRMLVAAQSARCLAAYAYAGAGVGESTTDLVFGGHTLLAENGRVLAEGERFVRKGTRVLADVDLAFLLHERRQNAVFADCSAHTAPLRRLTFGDGTVVERAEHPCVTELIRVVDPHPFVPSDRVSRDERCAEVFAIQSSGLATRLLHAGIKAVVVGVSGGLDSALALLAAYEAFDRAGLDRSGVHAVTMPGFGTTALTLDNARRLCEGLGVALEQIDITQACRQHLADLGHDGESHDITFENAQARERTQVLMDRANMLHALVVGSGDLSELALGWCTFNGDQMSMYGVNCGVPKTLVRDVIGWVAQRRVNEVARAALHEILETPVSPELLPAAANGEIAQKTEDVIGPYELHDFFLYHFVRCGASEAKIRFLAGIAFAGRYAPEEIARWSAVFFLRFYTQQFKRSSLPDGPKVGSVGLSPRGDWRMPSDVPVSSL